MARRKKYQYDKSYPNVYETHSFEFTWCCDCGLRHVNFFEVERGEKPEDDKIKIYGVRDSHGTNYRKDYERLKKERQAMPCGKKKGRKKGGKKGKGK